MCWSWEVSLGFSLAHWIGITYLLMRNKQYDKWYVVVLVPLAIQETMQFVGWVLIDEQNATAYTCDISLKVVGSFIIVSVASVPFCFCVLALAVNQDCARWRVTVLRVLAFLAFLHYLFAAITQLTFQYQATENTICTNIHGADDPSPGECYQCIHRGPKGHMVLTFFPRLSPTQVNCSSPFGI
eukprot:jgi/Botrbrau1/6994/Bobra.0165s0024.2